MIRVPGSLIVVGNRLIFDIYDESGKILLVRGTPIGTPEIASKIRKSGFRIPPSRKAGEVFRDMASIAERLEIIEEDIRMSHNGGAWILRIENLVKDFIQMSDVDPNAALGAIHLDHQHSYLVVHSMMVALVASRLALALDADPVTRHSIVGAGMTHDLALAPIRYAIDASPSLKEKYQEQIHQHPQRTVAMLRDFGLADPLWLEASPIIMSVSMEAGTTERKAMSLGWPPEFSPSRMPIVRCSGRVPTASV